MQKVNDLRQQFLSLIFSGNILKCYAGLVFFVDLGIGFSESAEHASAAHGLCHPLAQTHAEPDHQCKRQQVEDQRHDRGYLGRDLLCESGACIIHAVYFADIIDPACLIYRVAVLQRKTDRIGIQGYFVDIGIVQFLKECIIGSFDDAPLLQGGKQHRIDQDHNAENDQIVYDHRLFRRLYSIVILAPVVFVLVGIIHKIENISKICHITPFRLYKTTSVKTKIKYNERR